MTALVSGRVVRPVPWQRFGWVVWRRYRTTIVAVASVLSVLSVYLVVTGLRIRSAYDSLTACTPAHSAACSYRWVDFHNSYGSPGLIGTLFLFLPGLVGVFAGAPLFARELETGTFRYTWTQGAGRMRWSIAMLVPAALGSAAIMIAFGLLVSWHDRPLVRAGVIYRLHPISFPVSGVATAGWTLLGFALGVLVGVVWRRTLPALATAFGGWFGLAYLASVLRRHYLPPLTTTRLDLGNRESMTIAQWWERHGVRVPASEINRMLNSIGAQEGTSGKVTVHPGSAGIDPVHYLIQRGYTQVTSYQPDSRYWTFQWIELGWLAVLSLALIGTTLWLLRRPA